jgi:hypothetical protein
MVRAPEMNFQNPATANTRLPSPLPTTILPEQNPRANWALMTPAEIMGVVTPEQILKIPERDAAGRPKNTTALERFYERQDQARTNDGTGFLSGTPPLRWEFPGDENEPLKASGFNPAGSGLLNPAQQLNNPFQKPANADGQNGYSGWTKISISPPAPVQNPARVQDMADFEKLLEPSQPPKPASASSGERFNSAPQNLQGSVFSRPANSPDTTLGQFNKGIAALPGMPGQSVLPTVTAVPDWKPQPAPWMSKKPKPDVIPKRVGF